jgi:hypothetical protein
MRSPLKVLAYALGISALCALTVLAADVSDEIAKAATHAGLAAKAANVDGVHTHLHHAVNCIVGPKGTDFDKSQLNPCAGSGNGAIPDSMNATQKEGLQAALAKAKEGLAATDLAKAQAAATATAEALKKLQ